MNTMSFSETIGRYSPSRKFSAFDSQRANLTQSNQGSPAALLPSGYKASKKIMINYTRQDSLVFYLCLSSEGI